LKKKKSWEQEEEGKTSQITKERVCGEVNCSDEV